MSMHRNGSHLFLLRLWGEGARDGEGWQGRLQHVVSGEAHSFNDWPTLVTLLLAMLPQAGTDPADAGASVDSEVNFT